MGPPDVVKETEQNGGHGGMPSEAGSQRKPKGQRYCRRPHDRDGMTVMRIRCALGVLNVGEGRQLCDHLWFTGTAINSRTPLAYSAKGRSVTL